MPCQLLVFWTSQRVFNAQGLLGVGGLTLPSRHVQGAEGGRAWRKGGRRRAAPTGAGSYRSILPKFDFDVDLRAGFRGWHRLSCVDFVTVDDQALDAAFDVLRIGNSDSVYCTAERSRHLEPVPRCGNHGRNTQAVPIGLYPQDVLDRGDVRPRGSPREPR